jgi:hypothetical protein
MIVPFAGRLFARVPYFRLGSLILKLHSSTGLLIEILAFVPCTASCRDQSDRLTNRFDLLGDILVHGTPKGSLDLLSPRSFWDPFEK